MHINTNFFLNNQGVSNAIDTMSLPRHRWYYYKEGFSPSLVEKAIESCGLHNYDIIIDPFNGSGTTTLTSSLLGFKSIGVEVNPFTAFLSSSKVKNINEKTYKDSLNRIVEGIEKGSNSCLKGFSTFSKTEKNEKWLFNDEILDSFAGGWDCLNKIISQDVKQIHKLALIIAAMKNCNATRDGKCLRYRDGWQKHNYGKESFMLSFKDISYMIIDDIMQYPIKSSPPKIYNGDARIVLSEKGFDKFKLCITSPPYLNTFDYTDIYRPELFLGQFVKNMDDLYKLRLKTIRSHIQAKWETPINSDFGYIYKNCMKYLYNHETDLMHKRIPLMIQAYFEDMINVLKLLYNKAEKSAQLWFVVSNSAYADKEIPVDLIIADISKLAGWKLLEIGVLRNIKRRKTIHSPNINSLRESVIIMQK